MNGVKKRIRQPKGFRTSITFWKKRPPCSLFRKSSRARVKTLIVTGNYLQPRLLAELAQERTKQPVFLFQPEAGGEASRFHFLHANKMSEEISAAKLMDVAVLLNPKTVIVLGDDTCVPAASVAELRKEYSVMVLNSDDWEKNAQTLGAYLELPRLQRDFRDLKGRYDDNVLTPQE